MTATIDPVFATEEPSRQARAGDTRSQVTTDFKYLFMIDKDNGSKVPGYMKFSVPPDEVLDEARCSPDTAYLFDPQTPDEIHVGGTRFVRSRQAEAVSICQGEGKFPPCPVRQECLAYALKHRMTGVWGGTLLTEKTFRSRRKGLSDVIASVYAD